MKTVNVKMKAGDLKGIVDLPNYPDSQLVAVTVYPTVEDKKPTRQEVHESLEKIKSFWKYLDKTEEPKTFDEYRMERLEKKYGPFN